MNRKNRAAAAATARKWGELCIATPQVVAHRTARMALNGPVYSRLDQAEFLGMVQEKQLAFTQSWMAMWTEGTRVQQQWWLHWLGAAAQPWGSVWGGALGANERLLAGLQRTAAKGLAPVHRKAVANSRRLARTRLR